MVRECCAWYVFQNQTIASKQLNLCAKLNNAFRSYTQRVSFINTTDLSLDATSKKNGEHRKHAVTEKKSIVTK